MKKLGENLYLEKNFEKFQKESNYKKREKFA